MLASSQYNSKAAGIIIIRKAYIREAHRALNGANTDDTPWPFHSLQLGSERIHHASEVHSHDKIPLVIFQVLDGT